MPVGACNLVVCPIHVSFFLSFFFSPGFTTGLPQNWRYVGGGHLAAGGSWVVLVNRAGTGLTIVIEKMAWENVNQGQWGQKYFPTHYTTAPEQIRFVLPATLRAAHLGAWRSRFEAVSANADPGVWANVITNTSFLVRDPSVNISGGADAVTVTIEVGRNEMVTLSTEVEGIPDSAPVLSRPPAAAAGCKMPRELTDDFDALDPGTEAKFFQALHGAFEAVHGGSPGSRMALRQMSVGQPVGFHGTDSPPIAVVGAMITATSLSVSLDVMMECNATSAVSQLDLRSSQNRVRVSCPFVFVLPSRSKVLTSGSRSPMYALRRCSASAS